MAQTMYTPDKLFEMFRYQASPESKNCNGVLLTEEMIRKWANQPEPFLECGFCGENGTLFDMRIESTICCPCCREYKGIQPYIKEWSNWG